MTPDRELSQKSMKNMKFQHFQPRKDTKFGTPPDHLQPRTSELAKSMQNNANFKSFPETALNDPTRKA